MRGLPLVHFTMSLLLVGLGDTRSLKEGVSDLADILDNEIQLKNRNQTSFLNLKLKEDNQEEEIMQNKDETLNWVWDKIDSDEYFSETKINGINLSIDDGNIDHIFNGYEEHNNEKYIVNKGEVNQSYQLSKADRFGVMVYMEYRKVKDEHSNSSLLLYVQIDTDVADLDYSIHLCRTCDTPTARVMAGPTETAVATATPGATATATAKATGTATAKATATATGSSTAVAVSTASDSSTAATTSSSTGSARSTATSMSTGKATATATATATGSSTATTTSIATTTETATGTATSTASATDMGTAKGLAKTTSTSGATGTAATTATATGSSTAITSSIATTTDTATSTATSTASATGAAKAIAEGTATSQATATATATAKATATGADTITDFVTDIQPPSGDNLELVVSEKEIESINLTKPLFTTRIYLPLNITYWQ